MEARNKFSEAVIQVSERLNELHSQAMQALASDSPAEVLDALAEYDNRASTLRATLLQAIESRSQYVAAVFGGEDRTAQQTLTVDPNFDYSNWFDGGDGDATGKGAIPWFND